MIPYLLALAANAAIVAVPLVGAAPFRHRGRHIRRPGRHRVGVRPGTVAQRMWAL